MVLCFWFMVCCLCMLTCFGGVSFCLFVLLGSVAAWGLCEYKGLEGIGSALFL